MNRKAGITIGKRLRADIEKLEERLEREYPDPVPRLSASATAKATAGKGRSQQIDLDKVYESNGLLRPPFSMSVMTKLCDLCPYLAGAVAAIATNVSAGDMEIRWTGEGDEKKDERKILEAFFFEPNDPQNPVSINEKIKACAIDFITLGNWNLEIVKGGKAFADLVHAPAEFIRVKKEFAGYMMIKGTDKADFTNYGDKEGEKDEHQILRAINKWPGHRVYGKPMTFSLVLTVLMNSRRDDKNLDFFDQGALADLLILIEESIDKGIKEQIVADYQNTSDGSQTMYMIDGAGKAVVEQIKRGLEDKSFDTMERNNRQRVLTALRTPPAKVAIYEDANRANTLTQDEVFRNEVTDPMQKMFKVRFDHLIKHLFGFENWEYIIKPVSLKNRKEEAEIDKIYIDKGVLTVNEARSKLNREPVEGGEHRWMNTPLGLVDLATGEIAVAEMTQSPEAQERLKVIGMRDFILRLVELRKELNNFKGHDRSASASASAKATADRDI